MRTGTPEPVVVEWGYKQATGEVAARVCWPNGKTRVYQGPRLLEGQGARDWASMTAAHIGHELGLPIMPIAIHARESLTRRGVRWDPVA